MAAGYPAILVLEGRQGVVVGGGPVAERKARGLLEAGARVRVLAPETTEGLKEMARTGEAELIGRRFARGDLAGAAIAIAATDDREVNQMVYEEAVDRGIPVNVVDDPKRCTFIAPSIVRRGDLVIAISTGGNTPALAARIRQRFEREFGEEYAAYLEIMGDLRGRVRLPSSQEERARAWYRVVDSDVMDLVREGKVDEARERARAILEEAPAGSGDGP